ncbi:LysR substrate-binding domain-containing protein [Streptomyces yangpuensis]|uniref:LysR substrate-binding domain-containing protein n=1 Tax=Streptomyces yangpuensis TaxID=1648182 RepID=UPI0037190E7A
MSAAPPGIEVSLHEGPSDDLQAQTLAGALDLALIGYAGAVATGLEASVVIDGPITAAVPAGHPSTGRTCASATYGARANSKRPRRTGLTRSTSPRCSASTRGLRCATRTPYGLCCTRPLNSHFSDVCLTGPRLCRG